MKKLLILFFLVIIIIFHKNVLHIIEIGYLNIKTKEDETLQNA